MSRRAIPFFPLQQPGKRTLLAQRPSRSSTERRPAPDVVRVPVARGLVRTPKSAASGFLGALERESIPRIVGEITNAPLASVRPEGVQSARNRTFHKLVAGRGGRRALENVSAAQRRKLANSVEYGLNIR